MTPCERRSPLPALTEPRCVADHVAGERACVFPGTDGRSPLKVEPK